MKFYRNQYFMRSRYDRTNFFVNKSTYTHTTQMRAVKIIRSHQFFIYSLISLKCTMIYILDIDSDIFMSLLLFPVSSFSVQNETQNFLCILFFSFLFFFWFFFCSNMNQSESLLLYHTSLQCLHTHIYIEMNSITYTYYT